MRRCVAVGGVVLHQGAVLLVQRGRAPLEGTWSLPGGKVEPGEALDVAVAREVLEETGISVRVGPCVEVVTLEADGTVYEIHELLCEVAHEADVRAGDDARAARWCRLEDLDSAGVTDEVLRVVERATRRAAVAAAH